jgi:hypothetical protein
MQKNSKKFSLVLLVCEIFNRSKINVLRIEPYEHLYKNIKFLAQSMHLYSKLQSKIQVSFKPPD